MKVLLLGVGDAFTRRGFGSSALIHGPEGHVLLDCPDLVHRALHEATTAAGWTADASDVQDVLITHLHGDHCNGLESFGFYRMMERRRAGGSAPTPRVHTSPPAAERLWDRLAPAMDAPFDGERRSALADYFDLHLLDPDGAVTVAGLEVRCRFTRHPVPTVGLLIGDGGRTLGWSGDTAWDEDHLAWLSSADLIVHECNSGPAHTSLEKLEALPDELRSRIRLIHVPDDFDASRTDIPVLREGEVLEI
jgi:ribonuclease BN (tRNA processing enzyme)